MAILCIILLMLILFLFIENIFCMVLTLIMLTKSHGVTTGITPLSQYLHENAKDCHLQILIFLL